MTRAWMAEVESEKMSRRQWIVEAYLYRRLAIKWANSPYRREQEYAGYVKRFLFGDGEININNDNEVWNNEVWKTRKAERALPMPFNIYFG